MHIDIKILLALALSTSAVAADSRFVLLGDGARYPDPYAQIYAAVENTLRKNGRTPEKFHAHVDVCDADACAVTVFSRDIAVDPRQGGLPKSCPGDYCGTMKYSKKLQGITSVIRWK
jgi:hypothetical protein